MGRHRYRQYRQLFLFLLVLILPSILIVVQGRRIAAQERELGKEELQKRTIAEKKRTAAEIGQDVLARLERIKLQEMVNAPATGLSQPRKYSDSAVTAVGWADGDRLVWAWDIDASNEQLPRSDQDPEFARAMAEAEHAEFAEKRYDRATDLYRQSIEAARNEGQRASARLRLARTLGLSGAQSAAIAVYRDLLKLPSNLSDEYGLPFASYAATRLVEWRAALRDVLERVNRDLESPYALAPLQIYRLRSILETLESSDDRAIRESAGPALMGLSARMKDVEEAQLLQKDFPKLRVTAADWQIYESTEMWLVGRAPPGAASRPLVVAVRVETVRQSVELDRLSRKAGAGFQIASAINSGEPLSEHLPNLRATFPSVAETEANGLSPQRSFWGLSFVLVLTLTSLGGFLLWRDTRREAHIAELRTQFVSSVSHELKTPLTSIRMFAEILQMRGYTDPQLHNEYLETIVNESERLTRLLNNVLDFSRIERGQKTYRLEPAPLAEVVHAAVRTIQHPLAEQGFILTLNISDGLPPVAIDRDALQQAILNLLTNAMKYSGQSREIELRLCSEKDTALIEVSDRGIGIPEKEQSRIFEKFYRAPIPENRAISGTGLGLALVAHIAEAHGGGVLVKSSPGEGSTFSIRLPASPAPLKGLSDGPPTPLNAGGAV